MLVGIVLKYLQKSIMDSANSLIIKKHLDPTSAVNKLIPDSTNR